MFQGTFFDPNVPKYLNYGGIWRSNKIVFSTQLMLFLFKANQCFLPQTKSQ
jgi:hypothetical protein